MEAATRLGTQVRDQVGQAGQVRKPEERSSMTQVKRDDNVIKLPTWLISILISLVVLFSGTLATNIYWKGQVDEKIKSLEDRAREDRQMFKENLDYIRTQNEVNGKDLARIRIYFENQQEKKGR